MQSDTSTIPRRAHIIVVVVVVDSKSFNFIVNFKN